MAKRLVICGICDEEKIHCAHGLCRKCYDCQHLTKNRDRIREYQREWRGKNREHVREVSRKYYWDSHEKQLEYARRYRGKNRQICLERTQRWRKENPEKVKDYYERYRTENLEKIRARNVAYQREYRKRNPEKVKSSLHNWYLRNFEKVLVANTRRQAREISLPHTLTGEQVKVKLSIGHCFYCEKEIKLGIDHFVPLIKGGGTTLANSVAACKRCNSSKREKLPEEILVQLPLW